MCFANISSLRFHYFKALLLLIAMEWKCGDTKDRNQSESFKSVCILFSFFCLYSRQMKHPAVSSAASLCLQNVPEMDSPVVATFSNQSWYHSPGSGWTLGVPPSTLETTRHCQGTGPLLTPEDRNRGLTVTHPQPSYTSFGTHTPSPSLVEPWSHGRNRSKQFQNSAFRQWCRGCPLRADGPLAGAPTDPGSARAEPKTTAQTSSRVGSHRVDRPSSSLRRLFLWSAEHACTPPTWEKWGQRPKAPHFLGVQK